MIACATVRHLAPGPDARAALLAEGVPADNISIIGNPLRDLCRTEPTACSPLDVIATMHRRENRPQGIRRLCAALSQLASAFPDLQFGLLDHSHPVVHSTISAALQPTSNLHRVAPMPHRRFLGLLANARLVMTDSGGVQEEAAMLNRPTLVLRRRSDRPDGLARGTACCVGTLTGAIVEAAREYLSAPPVVAEQAPGSISPGEAAAQALIDEFKLEESAACKQSDCVVAQATTTTES